MSDKPIHAEIVRADQVKVGEKYAILTTGRAPLCSLGDVAPLWTRGAENEPGWIPEQIVARVTPDPVEVREFWRAECHSMAKEGTEQECRKWFEEIGYGGDMEEITEIVKRRIEVKP